MRWACRSSKTYGAGARRPPAGRRAPARTRPRPAGAAAGRTAGPRRAARRRCRRQLDRGSPPSPSTRRPCDRRWRPHGDDRSVRGAPLLRARPAAPPAQHAATPIGAVPEPGPLEVEARLADGGVIRDIEIERDRCRGRRRQRRHVPPAGLDATPPARSGTTNSCRRPSGQLRIDEGEVEEGGTAAEGEPTAEVPSGRGGLGAQVLAAEPGGPHARQCDARRRRPGGGGRGRPRRGWQWRRCAPRPAGPPTGPPSRRVVAGPAGGRPWRHRPAAAGASAPPSLSSRSRSSTGLIRRRPALEGRRRSRPVPDRTAGHS